MPFASGPVLMYVGNGQYETVGPTEYVGARDVITVPSGFRTDLASVPRAFWSILPPNGTYERAAVVHDAHCVRLAAGDCAVTSREADGLFRRMAREGGAGLVTRWLLWLGVRLGALVNPARRPGISRDLPLMAAISAAVLTATGATLYVADQLAHLIGDAL